MIDLPMPGAPDLEAPAAPEPQPAVLHRLRQDLQLMPGARTWNGEPTWTLLDPLRNRFFQLGEREVMLLRHWQEGDPQALMLKVRAAEGVTPELEEVLSLQGFLQHAELLDAAAVPLRDRLITLHKAREQTWWQMLLHHYLFIRIPLLRPDKWLDRLYPHLRLLFQPWFPRFTATVGVVGLLLALMNWEHFKGEFGWFTTPSGALAFMLTLVTVKILHEMGHALMCKHFGLRVPTMGVTLLVMWPVLYTDATEGWRLTSRRQRALIDSAGVITELSLACYALFLWNWLPDGLFRSIAFIVATTTIALSLAVNLNPLMRFDGYFFVADITNIPNLQERSFAVARARLRRWLFGLDVEIPENFPPRTLNLMTIYAWVIWVYRFFLFIGIAVLVYFMFFKVLGVILFLVEIFWFLLRPIWNEVKNWRELAPRASLPRKRLFQGLAALLLLLLAFPWRSDVNLPALLSAAQYSRVYLVADARVEALGVRDGERVRAGQVLMRLESPELASQLAVARIDLARLDTLLGGASTERAMSRDRLVLEQDRLRALAAVQALERQQEQLTVTAPFDGVVRDLVDSVTPGQWLSSGSPLLTVVAPAHAEVMAWVSESDRDRLLPRAQGTFWSEVGHGPQAVAVELAAVDTSAVRELDPPWLAAVYGGSIAVAENRGRLVPETALYRVRLDVGERPDALMMAQRWRGHVRVKGQRHSLLGRAVVWLAAAVIRQGGL